MMRMMPQALLSNLILAMICLAPKAESNTATRIVKKSAVIVGAGPCGLAASLVLNKLGWEDVTIIEKRSPEFFEATKAYLYLIDKRGQRCMDLIDMTSKIAKRAVKSSETGLMNEVLTTGEVRPKALAINTKKDKETGALNERYWIPRSELLLCLQDELKQKSGITMRYSSVCDGIDIDKDTGKIIVRVSGIDNEGNPLTNDLSTFVPDLVLGTDGLNSIVRSFLAKNYDTDVSRSHQNNNNPFNPISLNSAAAGLKYKMLTLQNRFPLPVSTTNSTDSTTVPSPQLSTPESMYVYRSVAQTATTRLNIGLLPVKGEAKRTGNFICLPSHDLWKQKNPTEVKSFLQKSFPQIDFNSFVTDEEIKRFTEAIPGEFPKPTYIKKLQTLFPVKKGGTNPMKNEEIVGVTLMGDSVHAFPPDLGQVITL